MTDRELNELIVSLRDEDNCNVLDDIDAAADALESLVDRLSALQSENVEKDREIAKLKLEKELMRQEWDESQAALSRVEAERDTYRALGPIEELSALFKARREGRVHIDPPPAKEGDPKPGCFYEDGGTIWCLGLAPDESDEPCDRCKACWYCESGDYADDRAEAEAAISAQRGDPHETNPV